MTFAVFFRLPPRASGAGDRSYEGQPAQNRCYEGKPAQNPKTAPAILCSLLLLSVSFCLSLLLMFLIVTFSPGLARVTNIVLMLEGLGVHCQPASLARQPVSQSVQPASPSAKQPASQPVSQPASKPASQPASRAAGHAASQSARSASKGIQRLSGMQSVPPASRKAKNSRCDFQPGYFLG